ncbi:hypothetical protein EVJ58_g2745 [Rhodofomes roseus]|uniref:DNA mismatch repair protein MutL n=1 Tax=Rhodofomes roseus TaxID=34475 RepID=A0A4Y9YR41_9APHY|nr:hypothetical protein EVJ58_g2745 [Rhodofomes roseus]
MTAEVERAARSKIKALDGGAVHKISSGQVVIDLQTAVKELVENSLDAGATSLEVRFKDHGVASFEVIDNGSGIAPEDYDAIVTTCTAAEAPMGTILEFDSTGRLVGHKGKVARQRGTTVTVSGLFKPLPVRRRELERNAKREFGKALALLSAYALVPCAHENKGVRLTVTHQAAGGKKSVQMRTDGSPSTRASISALWGPKALENLVELDIVFPVEAERAVLRRRGIVDGDTHSNEVRVRGQISKFAVGCGRSGTDRQFFFVNGRPYNPSKKAFNEVYRTFNANQAPFIVADFILPTDSLDVNVSPDKRTILLHSEKNLIEALKVALEQKFAPSRATYDIRASGASQAPAKESNPRASIVPDTQTPLFLDEDVPDDSGRSSPISNPSPSPMSAHAVEDVQPDVFGRPNLLVGNQVMGETAVGLEAAANEAASARASEVDATLVSRVSAPEEPMDPEDREASAESSHLLVSKAPRRGSAEGPRVVLDEDSIAHPEVQDSGEDQHSSLSLSQMQPAFAESGSPSASQVPPAAIAQPADEADEADSNSPLSYDRHAKRCFAEQNDLLSATGGSRSVQMVLSTQGASWNLRQSADEEPAPPKRRRKTPALEAVGEGLSARQGLRSTLRDFARTGSQIVDESMDEDEDASEASMHREAELEIQYSSVVAGNQQDVDMDSRSSPYQDMRSPGGNELPEESCPLHRPGETDATQDEVIDLTDSNGDSADPYAAITSPSPSAYRPEVLRTAEGEEALLSCDVPRITDVWRRRALALPTELTRPSASGATRDAGISNVQDDAKAAETLSRVIDKSDFGSMEVVGQFNLGFIIGRRRKRTSSSIKPIVDEALDDLFIIDQHAADEKYNFETLQETTKIESQRLFRPQPLEFAAADALLATENIDILRRNGFEIKVDEDAIPGEGHRLHLVAQPTSKSTVFDMKDLEELLHLMQDRPAGQMVRCSKASAMFAMRACRKSVMVGMPLNRQQMISEQAETGGLKEEKRLTGRISEVSRSLNVPPDLALLRRLV